MSHAETVFLSVSITIWTLFQVRHVYFQHFVQCDDQVERMGKLGQPLVYFMEPFTNRPFQRIELFCLFSDVASRMVALSSLFFYGSNTIVTRQLFLLPWQQSTQETAPHVNDSNDTHSKPKSNGWRRIGQILNQGHLFNRLGGEGRFFWNKKLKEGRIEKTTRLTFDG